MEDARTRIVCTIGPASSSPTLLTRMMKAGMDVARLNFSHGTHEEHAVLFRSIHRAAQKAGKFVAVLQDLQGPKIRVGLLPKSGIMLRHGQTVTLTTAVGKYVKGGGIPLTDHVLHKYLRVGHRVLLDDGTMALTVLRVRNRHIFCSVDVGGLLTAHKGVNIPDTSLPTSALTKKDLEDLSFGVALGVDWVCVSFVSSAAIIKKVRDLTTALARKYRHRPPRIMAKVERRAALEHFDAILAAADGIMLGRGDLGVEVPPEEVPLIQKDITERCRLAGKPCIVATHMLESMRTNVRATRAEISDVATAVFDHADAVMLSAESATGKYPAAAVQAMAAAIRAAEASAFDDIAILPPADATMQHIFAQTLALLAQQKHIEAMIVPATFASYATSLSLYRPNIPLGVVVPDEQMARQAIMQSGVHPIITDDASATFLSRISACARDVLRLRKGTCIAVISPFGSQYPQLSILRIS